MKETESKGVQVSGGESKMRTVGASSSFCSAERMVPAWPGMLGSGRHLSSRHCFIQKWITYESV
jgi:hypothetical protein